MVLSSAEAQEPYSDRLKTNLPEQSFKIFWQFSTSCVARIHGYKNTHSWHERNVFTLEYESFFFISYSILYRLHLYGDDRQYFNRDTIEFIKATPSTGLSETFVDITTGL